GRGNYPEIRRLLEGIVDVEPDFAMKRAVYAQILLELGDVEGARGALRKAAALDPQNPDVLGVREAFRTRGLAE
ncbi:MAG TPA: tetratricopeptide repeat protein, partial [Candidatus Polarisedimenticolaceae bacterium]|nr:tetratricopeptide repeat protein [Candidatus Polarisedimenticolaceae bacterium]